MQEPRPTTSLPTIGPSTPQAVLAKASPASELGLTIGIVIGSILFTLASMAVTICCLLRRRRRRRSLLATDATDRATLSCDKSSAGFDLWPPASDTPSAILSTARFSSEVDGPWPVTRYDASSSASSACAASGPLTWDMSATLSDVVWQRRGVERISR